MCSKSELFMVPRDERSWKTRLESLSRPAMSLSSIAFLVASTTGSPGRCGVGSGSDGSNACAQKSIVFLSSSAYFVVATSLCPWITRVGLGQRLGRVKFTRDLPGRKCSNARSKFFSSTSDRTGCSWACICRYAARTTTRNLRFDGLTPCIHIDILLLPSPCVRGSDFSRMPLERLFLRAVTTDGCAN